MWRVDCIWCFYYSGFWASRNEVFTFQKTRAGGSDFSLKIPIKKPRRRGSWYVKYHRFRKYQEESEILAPGRAPHRSKFWYAVSNWWDKTIGQTQMNFFEQDEENVMHPEGTISGDDVHYWSEENRKMAWMREKRIKLFMQMDSITAGMS